MKKRIIKTLALTLILALLLSFTAGCELISATSTPTAPSNTTEAATEKPVVTPQAPLVTTSPPAMPLPSIADVVAKVKPAVVAINTEITSMGLFGPTTQKGAGSGWIIRQDGLIITNNHVVQGAKGISVTLDDGQTFSVDLKTVATDPLTDLAVFKINATNLPVAQVGDSTKLRIGDWVVAIGNSLGEGIRATQGIVSRKDVSLTVQQTDILYGLIETDAAINAGNSGGPLVNMAGEVVGITSAKLAAVGIEATGFAISTEVAMPIIEQLISTGRAIHPWLGVSLYPIDQVIVQTYNLAVDKGALVVEVSTGSPAWVAGIRSRDIIVGFAGKEITTVNALIQAIRQARVGQQVEIVYWRGNTKRTTTATLAERPY